ncbi:MAG: asparaginase [Clostridia bacterium]|nr:asparaginase [Clostridia bacterium]
MKILVIFTGGTIGSSVKNGWIGIDAQTRYTLLNNYKGDKDYIEFHTCSPYSVLSENLSAAELNSLQAEISKNLSLDYGGIIITHGTDTLQYTSSAIEYAFCDSKIPIVFVSADYPLENPKSNGNANFEAAVEFIKSKSASGVFVAYKNTNENHANIHIASRIVQHRECDANIYSIDGFSFAIYNHEIKKNNISLSCSVKPTGIVNYSEKSNILTIESVPGCSYSHSLEGINAVILKPYHSATLNTKSKELSEFCKKAAEENIPVFVVNVPDGIKYESSKEFDNLGIIPLPYSTYISVYMKLWIAISNKYDIIDYMKNPVANEFIL